MRIFGSDRIKGILEKLGMEEDQEIQHPWITKSIERAQTQVEAHNFDIRKHLLEYDDVMNQQRKVIYQERDIILENEDISEHLKEVIEEVATEIIDTYAHKDLHPEDRDIEGLIKRFREVFSVKLSDESLDRRKYEELRRYLLSETEEAYRLREGKIGSQELRQLERMIFLHVIDNLWKDHLYSMDTLKEGIGLRGYGQKDPLIEYKHEAYQMFEDLMSRIKEEVVTYLFKVQILVKEDSSPKSREGLPLRRLRPKEAIPTTDHKHKIGRNAPCPCGSGKKYKRCCGSK